MKNLADAIDAIRTATVLGETIPAIPGTKVYLLVFEYEYGRYRSIHGLYPTQEHAHRAAADVALGYLLDAGYDSGSWADDPAFKELEDETEMEAHIARWCAEKGDAEVIGQYFDGEDNNYEIIGMTVEPDGPLPALMRAP